MSEGTGEQAAPDTPEVSRRSLLKAGVPIVAFIALEAIGGIGATNGPAPGKVKNAEGVVFPDPTLCIGCLTCEVICSQEHERHGLSNVPRIRIFNDPTTKVDPVIQAAYPDRGRFHQEPCLQCPTAECLYVCPVDALKVEPRTGARYIDEDRCVTCGRCNEACIFPTSDLAEATNRGDSPPQTSRITYDPVRDTFAKCDLCFWRDGGPACVERCPINIRIRQGIIKTDAGRMCLSLPASDKPTWDKLRAFQTFDGSPAAGKA
ncbi:MAG TPA: 4Fe-4S dicluster domain-containing protein [Candidatus Limnocylindria bacterium]|nr:4Fe-4S dicluster domain-containing protein [Candidatus Limnocylindria bacterium]